MENLNVVERILLRGMAQAATPAEGRDGMDVNAAVVAMLADLHMALLASPRHGAYQAAYYRVLPLIVELRAKAPRPKGEVETCLDALYGVMLLRMQGRQVSAETRQATEHIAAMMRLLAEAYELERQGELEL